MIGSALAAAASSAGSVSTLARGVLVLLATMAAMLVALPLGAEPTRLPLPGGVTVDPASERRGVAVKGAPAPSFAERVVELVNQERLANGGLAPLKKVALLDTSAEAHSTNMATRDFFAHCDLDTGDDPVDRVQATGYVPSRVGENIAAGQGSPESVMASWMASSGHRSNILNLFVTEIGVGYFEQVGDTANIRRDLSPSGGDCVADSFGNGPYLRYWTQNFGSRSGVFPVVIDREAFATESATVELYIYGAGAANEMRIRNAPGGTFTPWLPIQTIYPWVLTGAAGVKVVEVELRSGVTPLGSASDSIVLTVSAEDIFADGFEAGDLAAWSSTVP